MAEGVLTLKENQTHFRLAGALWRVNENFLEGKRVLEEELREVGPEITNSLILHKGGSESVRLCDLISCRLHDKESEPGQEVAKVFLLYNEGRRVADRDEVPERCHFREVRLEEFAMELT